MEAVILRGGHMLCDSPKWVRITYASGKTEPPDEHTGKIRRPTIDDLVDAHDASTRADKGQLAENFCGIEV